jgi:hypothetical protein
MRATIRTALLMTAILLILGLTAPSASAHSGRSKHGHEVSRRTQGRSSSDPDGMTNGGRDKPGFRGGFSADRDGNNGCGNDDDREDDNNGNCGRREVRAAAVAAMQQEQDDRCKVKCETIFMVRAARVFEGEKTVGVTVAGTAVSLVFEPKVHALVFQPAAQAFMAVGLPAPQLAVKAAVEAVVQPAATPVSQAAVLSAAAPVSQPAVVPAASPPAEVAAAPPAETVVLGTQLEQQPAPAVTVETKVAGTQESRLGALALTGLVLGGLALLGAGLVAISRLARGVGSA